MRLNQGIMVLMLSATLGGPASVITGCASNGLAYDSYGGEYHRWNRDDERLYRQWEYSTHRSHLEFDRRTPGDRQVYWGWRHGNSSASHRDHFRR